ncbi:PAS domain S-box protein [Candidatus Poribacteria bacterium]
MGDVDKAKEQSTGELVELRRRVAELEASEAEYKRVDEKLHHALEESQQRQAEVSVLLEGSRAVLRHREFHDSARSIFDSCKDLVGATGGYVALLPEGKTEYELVFLESGGLPCDIDPSLPMPVRGLREEAYGAGQTVYANDFSESEWTKYIPEGHMTLGNVLFAPLIIGGRSVGLLGLANKPGGFTKDDARLASTFAEFAAIALHNSQILESLESSEQRCRSIVETATDAIITADSSGNINFWNRGAATVFGYSVEEAIGMSVTAMMPERFREAHEKGMERVCSTGESCIIGKTLELTGLKKNGSEFPIELSLASWEAKEDQCFTAIIRDITQRKEEEARKATEEELDKQRVLSMRSDRLRSLGEMAAGIAHELNQPLVGVRGMAEHLLLSIARGWELTEEKIQERAEAIMEQADRMVHIIEHIRMFARESGSPELRPVHINNVVKSSMDMLGIQFRSRGVELKCELAEDLPVVLANPFSLEEVLINLLVNARDALEEQAKIDPESGPLQILLRTLLDQTDPEEHVKVEVVDSGVGIPEHILNKAFDPFFTTKEPDKGTGLGLSITKSIVEEFGGTIDIQSTPGLGTTVTISLPVAQ